MEPVSKATLRRIVEQFPAVPWDDAELDELVAPQYGVITGFGVLFADIEMLMSIDLGATAPAPLRPRPMRR